MTILPLVVQAASLGLSACFSPGPLFMYLISQSLLGGWKRGAIVAIAPLVSDIPLVIIIFAVQNQIPPLVLRVLSFLGGVYLLFLALRLFRTWQGSRIDPMVTSSDLPGDLFHAVVVNYSSPGPYLFWSLVNGPLLLSALHTSILHGIAFLIGFYGVFVGGMLVLAGIFAQARHLPRRVVRIMSVISVIVLCSIGFTLIYRSFWGKL